MHGVRIDWIWIIGFRESGFGFRVSGWVQGAHRAGCRASGVGCGTAWGFGFIKIRVRV